MLRRIARRNESSSLYDVLCPKVAPAHHAEAFTVEFELGPREACDAAERNRAQVHLEQNEMKRRFIKKSGDPLLTILKRVHLQVGLFQELFFAPKLQQGKL